MHGSTFLHFHEMDLQTATFIYFHKYIFVEVNEMTKKESHNLTFKDETWQAIDAWRRQQQGRLATLSKDVEFLVQVALQSITEN